MKKISICIALIFASIFVQASQRPKPKPRAHKVFAHYMFQWGTNWLQKCYLHPLIGEYNQLDPDVIEYHILLARAAHIDGFIMNPTSFKAGNSLQVRRLLAFTSAIGRLNEKFPECDIQYIFSYDDNNTANGDRNIIRENYRWVRDSIVRHPERRKYYFHDDVTGKAVIMAWSAQGVPYHYEAIGDFFGHDSTLFMAQGAKNFDYSDGNFPWISMGSCKNLADSSICWGESALNSFYNSMEQHNKTLAIGNVYPGFDDRIVHSWTRDGAWRYMKRVVNDGEVMAITWDKNINFKSATIEVPWIQITTWNDWAEGTSIEPGDAKSFGYQAIQICRKKALDFKNIKAGPADSLGVTVPYEIFKLRKKGMNARADAVLNLFMKNKYSKALKLARS